MPKQKRTAEQATAANVSGEAEVWRMAAALRDNKRWQYGGPAARNVNFAHAFRS